MAALAEALHEDDKYARIVVLEANGGVGPLVRYVSFQEEEVEAMLVIT